MKKIALLAAFAMIAAPAMADWPGDPAGTETLLIPMLSAAPVIDAQVDDVWNIAPQVVPNTWKIIAAPDDAADLTCWFKAGWYGNSLYFGVYVEDNDYDVSGGQDQRELLEIYIDLLSTLTQPHQSAGVAQWDATAGPTQFGYALSSDLEPYGEGTNAHIVNDATRQAATDARSVYALSQDVLNDGESYVQFLEIEIKIPAGITLADQTAAFPFMLAQTDMDGDGGWTADDTFATWWGTAGAPWTEVTTTLLGTSSLNQWNDPAVWAAAQILTAADDADGDGVPDGWETNTGTYVGPDDTGTDPNVADSDGDLWPDGAEIEAGTDPTDANDTPTGLPPGVPAVSGFGLVLLGAALVAARKIRG